MNRMTEKRFKITKSKLVQNAHVIEDGKKQFTFPTLVGDNRGLIGYEKALNELSEENDQLKQRVSDLNKLLKSETIGKSDGKITKVKTEEFIRICQENTKLKEELESFEQVSFTDLCDKSRTVLYMKKENVGDMND